VVVELVFGNNDTLEPRLRHAYGEYNNVLIGRTWSNYNSFVGNTAGKKLTQNHPGPGRGFSFLAGAHALFWLNLQTPHLPGSGYSCIYSIPYKPANNLAQLMQIPNCKPVKTTHRINRCNSVR
jgi:hypothetical protein